MMQKTIDTIGGWAVWITLISLITYIWTRSSESLNMFLTAGLIAVICSIFSVHIDGKKEGRVFKRKDNLSDWLDKNKPML